MVCFLDFHINAMFSEYWVKGCLKAFKYSFCFHRLIIQNFIFAIENNCSLNATKCIHFNPFNGFFCRRLIEQISSVFVFFLFLKMNEKMFSLILKTFIQSIYSSSYLIKYFYTEIGNCLMFDELSFVHSLQKWLYFGNPIFYQC